jgi:gamma-glutamyltranspeptidase
MVPRVAWTRYRATAHWPGRPDCVDGWEQLLKAHGRLSLSEVLEPAIDYAEAGFPVSPVDALADVPATVRSDFSHTVYMLVVDRWGNAGSRRTGRGPLRSRHAGRESGHVDFPRA